MSRTVPTIETAIEPPQPRRLEKKTNMQSLYLMGFKGTRMPRSRGDCGPTCFVIAAPWP